MTATLYDAKVLGGIGSIFVLLGVVPNVGWILGIAGLVMILLAIYDISKAVNERKIYDNMLKAIAFGVGALAVGAVTVVSVVSKVLSVVSFVGGKFVLSSGIAVGSWLGIIGIAAVGFIAVEALLIVSAVFVRRTYDVLGNKLNVGRFKTAGLLYLIGAATTVVGVGFALIFVAEILMVLSFFSIRSEQQLQAGVLQTPATPLG
ncbi:MAG: DUF996 domain-containing protein [Nitrososphaerota archaeon]|nr:DUF996 domain-containing protein [Nitrososphaerota archaeon]MDG6924065.1 DUF996 domain-containing protein [Nitrososphaerota archaeon]